MSYEGSNTTNARRAVLSDNLTVEWIDAGREPQCAPDPRFPNGVDIDVSKPGELTCQTALPYPALRCGQFLVSCSKCGFNALVTTAGRPDDPRSIKIPCKVS